MRSYNTKVTFEDAATRLVMLAQLHHGTITAGQVEADDALSADRGVVTAAAKALATGTNVLATVEADGRAWFPFSSLTFSRLYGRG